MQPKVERKTLRTTRDDMRLIRALEKKLGVTYSQIVRIALRRLAEQEGIQAA